VFAAGLVFCGGLSDFRPGMAPATAWATSQVDNVYFTVPNGVPYGCQVPVAITAGGVAANVANIALTADGSPCQ